ncbi:MAG: hypothetical protein ACLTT9_02880 [Phocaeicola vulgatus]
MIQTIRSVSVMAYPIIDLDKAEKDIVDNYEKKTAWCGGFKAACEKYYQRICYCSCGHAGSDTPNLPQ